MGLDECGGKLCVPFSCTYLHEEPAISLCFVKVGVFRSEGNLVKKIAQLHVVEKRCLEVAHTCNKGFEIFSMAEMQVMQKGASGGGSFVLAGVGV